MANRGVGPAHAVDETMMANSTAATDDGPDNTRQIRSVPSGPGSLTERDPVTGRAGRGDRVTGSPVWSGFVVGLATWILLEVVLVAVDLTGISSGPGAGVEASEWWWSLAAGVVALFVGGLFAGAASRWRTSGDGALQGLTVWALTVVGLLVLAALGAGIGFGAFGDVVGIDGAVGAAEIPAGAAETAQDAAGIAVLALVLTAAAAAAGGSVGAKMWPASRRRTGVPATMHD